MQSVLKTSLSPLWVTLGAKFVPFADTSLPLQFAGTLSEHAATRTAAGLFDISHMGQIMLSGEHILRELEKLTPASLIDMPMGKMRYTFLTNERGGIIDDIIITHIAPNQVMIVGNGARRQVMCAHLRELLPAHIQMRLHGDWALMALQGPAAAEILQRLDVPINDFGFMYGTITRIHNILVRLARCGYSGEDGFELSVHTDEAIPLAKLLLADSRVVPCGLGARDTLRLEAGLPLYGQDLTEDTDPVSANLHRFIGKRRRQEGGFIGDTVILPLLQKGSTQTFVGFKPEGTRPVRAGAILTNHEGEVVGRITSGTFSPTLRRPIAMGYVDRAYKGDIFVNDTAMRVVDLPFVSHNYYKG